VYHGAKKPNLTRRLGRKADDLNDIIPAKLAWHFSYSTYHCFPLLQKIFARTKKSEPLLPATAGRCHKSRTCKGTSTVSGKTGFQTPGCHSICQCEN